LCQKIGLSLFGICLFFGGFWPFEKLGLPPKNKLLAGRLVLDPLLKLHITIYFHSDVPGVNTFNRITKKELNLGKSHPTILHMIGYMHFGISC